PGDRLEVDTPLITLETDKATMDVPSPVAGTLVELTVRKGERVSAGVLIARVETAPEDRAGASGSAVAQTAAASPATDSDSLKTKVLLQLAGVPEEIETDRSVQLLVLGAGPGGYTAAFRAADLGL